MDRRLTIVNQDLTFKPVSLIEPTNSTFLHIAAEIDRSPFPFFLWTSAKKKFTISQAKQWCRQLDSEAGVLSATVFKASLIPPGKGRLLNERIAQVQIARYDFAILIEADDASVIDAILSSNAYKRIKALITESANLIHSITATNVKRIGPVDHKKPGVFLFNYFYADDLSQNLAVWEYTAGWFQQETGLDNSTVLLPKDKKTSKYAIINHCRWNKMSDILPSLLIKPSFRSYVLANFYANNVAAMPILYTLV